MNAPNWKKLAAGGGSSAVLLIALLGYFEPSSTPGIPYQDITGKWTNCLGNTHEVDPKLFYTPQQCKVIDMGNQVSDMEALSYYVKVPLSTGQRAAFADFIHNVGSGNFQHSTMLRYINAGNVLGGCRELLKWVYAGGKKLSGLVTRRQAEYQLCILEAP